MCVYVYVYLPRPLKIRKKKGVTPMGWMEKMIQYKEKAVKQVCIHIDI